jgi:hypothetical protein
LNVYRKHEIFNNTIFGLFTMYVIHFTLNCSILMTVTVMPNQRHEKDARKDTSESSMLLFFCFSLFFSFMGLVCCVRNPFEFLFYHFHVLSTSFFRSKKVINIFKKKVNKISYDFLSSVATHWRNESRAADQRRNESRWERGMVDEEI